MKLQSNIGETALPINRNDLVQNFKFEIQDKSQIELRTVFNELNFLCLELDPYNSDDLSTEEKILLDKYNLEQYLGNTFEYTNVVLQLLDFLQNKIKGRLH